MKDFIMKHPFITFILIEDILIAMQNILLGRRKPFMMREMGYKLVDGMEQYSKKASEEKRPIGFVAS